MTLTTKQTDPAREKIDDYMEAFRLIAPFVHPVGDGIQMTLYVCVPLNPLYCNVVSSKPGDCPIHGTALMPHIYTWE